MKPKKCKVCQEVFTPVQFAQAVCNYKCAMIHSKKLKEQKEAREWKANKAILKNKLKTLSQYEAEAKKVFQKYIRMRDEKLPCISCGTTKKTEYAGGHYFKAEVYSGLIFDERNCHKQCNAYCNKYRYGAQAEYRIGLVARYGKEYVESLENDSIEKRNYKYTKEELIAKKLQYEIKIKEL